jgi:hypothetical protein
MVQVALTPSLLLLWLVIIVFLKILVVIYRSILSLLVGLISESLALVWVILIVVVRIWVILVVVMLLTLVIVLATWVVVTLIVIVALVLVAALVLLHLIMVRLSILVVVSLVILSMIIVGCWFLAWSEARECLLWLVLLECGLRLFCFRREGLTIKLQWRGLCLFDLFLCWD